jgi:hypothetical protein
MYERTTDKAMLATVISLGYLEISMGVKKKFLSNQSAQSVKRLTMGWTTKGSEFESR